MRAVLHVLFVRWCCARPFPTRPGLGSGQRSGGELRWYALASGRSALALLVAQVLADDHDPTVATNDLALVADRLDARLDLHGRPTSFVGRLVRCGGDAGGSYL